MQAEIEQAKAEFSRAIEGLKHTLATTPAERLKWSPSESARTPLQIAAHVAIGGRDMLGNLTGDTFPIKTTEEAERYHRERDSKVDTLPECLRLLDELTTDYTKWLDDLTDGQLDSLMKLPFGMGEMPIRVGVAVMPFHVQWHTAQITYIQTIYGDHDWHIPAA